MIKKLKFPGDMQVKFSKPRFITKFHVLLFNIFYKKLILGKKGVFIKSNDILLLNFLNQELYEKNIIQAINYLCEEKKYFDFFIDIGANIGLVTINVSKQFKNLYLVEPVKEHFNILKTNIKRNFKKISNFYFYNFALSNKNGFAKITIPKENIGSSRIEESNSYLNYKNYDIDRVEKINLYPTAKFLKDIFKNLNENKITKGVIKIDTEGYEEIILNDIFSFCDTNFNFKPAVIFESLEMNQNIYNLCKHSSSRVEFYKIEEKSKLIDFFLFRNSVSLKPIKNSSEVIGDLIIIFR